MSAENNASIVARVVVPSGVRVLLTGDIERLRSGQSSDRAPTSARTSLKVPHHGSRHQDPDFLRAVQPTAALISVGAEQRLRPPVATHRRPARGCAGAATFRTDTSGDIAVTGTRAAAHFTGRRSALPVLGASHAAPAEERALLSGVAGTWEC
jgi:competence protein ComEC